MSDEEPRGTVRPTGPAVLCVFTGLGLVAGWAVRPVALRMDTTEPRIGWTSIGVIFFLAAIVAVAAYHTWRLRRDGQRLVPHRAVNRLVLGKACALVGAVLLGGYLGFAIGHLGVSGSDLAPRQLWRSLLAALGGALVMTAALLLEQACRVPDDRG